MRSFFHQLIFLSSDCFSLCLTPEFLLGYICGDFGGVWAGTPEKTNWLDWPEEKPFTTLFIDGNHENFNKLNALPVHIRHGGKVHYIRPHVIHLMRGRVFEISGLTFFTMGGAASHDIQNGILDPASPGFEREYWFKRGTRQMFRVKGVSWRLEEPPSDEEYEEVVKNLKRANWRVDCVLTRCFPFGRFHSRLKDLL